MGLALVAVFLYAGSMSTVEIVAAQNPGQEYWLGVIPIPTWYAADPAAVLRHLRDRDDRRDQPRALRPPRGRGRAGRRVPHRVLQPEVRAVLPRRVHQHGDRVRARDHAVPRRLARPVADHPDLGGRRLRLLAAAVVLRQDAALHLHVHLAARLAAATALRPVHGVRLEAADPDLAGLDHRRRDDPRRSPSTAASTAPTSSARPASSLVLFLVLFFIGDSADEDEADGPATEAESTPSPAASRSPPMPAGGAVRGAAAPLTFADRRTTVTAHRRTPTRIEEK